MKKSLQLGAVILGVAVTTAIVAAGTYATVPNEEGNNNFFGKRAGMSLEDREARIEAMKNGEEGNFQFKKEENFKEFKFEDYQSWLEKTEGKGNRLGCLEKINEENFSQFAEAHKLMRSGDIEGATAIFNELGIEKPFAYGMEKEGMKKFKNRKANCNNSECPFSKNLSE